MRLLPCGHTESQAAWLGCTEAECRPRDRQLSEEYWASRGGMPKPRNFYKYAQDPGSERAAEAEGRLGVAEEDKEREELYPDYNALARLNQHSTVLDRLRVYRLTHTLRGQHPSHENDCE